MNNPPLAPLNLLAFTQRDFVSASGYSTADRVVVKVIHSAVYGGGTISTDPANPIIPVEDPATPGLGIVEVNHPGGACWFGNTPDIRPGDKVQIDVIDGPDKGRSDATTVRNVTAGRPIQTAPDTIQIHGTAVSDTGAPLTLAELEQRLVVPRDAFDKNGRRTLRATNAAGSDGTLNLDAGSTTNWTATYTGLDAADITRALNAESRGMWIPAGLTEGTVYENGAAAVAGPAAPCTAPLEKLPPPPGSETEPPTTPTGLTGAVTGGNTVTLNWTASTDNVGVVDYGVYRDGLAIATVQSADGTTPPAPKFIDANVPPGTYVYTVDAGDAVGNRSGLSNSVSEDTARPAANLPLGTTVNDPPVAPVQIISFPARDFVSATGYLPTDTVEVQVLRQEGGQLTLISSSNLIPQDDPATPEFEGLVEINHPGGGCWDGTTPDIRAGDIVRTIARNITTGAIRSVDQTRTATVSVTRTNVEITPATVGNNGMVKVHGVAMGADGKGIDPSQIEQRMIARRDAFDLNGRRALRAGGAGKDGTLAYDATDLTGTHWTAIYTGLGANDIGRIQNTAEFRTLWLGSQPLAGLELTIFENEPSTILNGPSVPPCAAGQSPSEPFDVTPPSAPVLSGSVDATNPKNFNLSWTAATDNVAVLGYTIRRDDQPIANVGPTVLSYVDASASAATAHTYTVQAFDAASPDSGLPSGQNKEWGNRSALSNTVLSTLNDTTAPSVPTNLVATVSGTMVALSWSASKDDVGVTGYGIYRNGTKVGGDVTATSASFTEAVGSYSYAVDAVDAAGNRSAQSAAATANVTGAADMVAPSVPTGLAAATSPDVHGRDIKLTWTASTDNQGGSGVTGYGVYRNGNKIADVPASPTPTYTDVSLATATYTYTVDAVDSAGNRSQQSGAQTGVVANDPPLTPHSVIAFPARDFISTTGYTPGAKYTFQLIRGGTVFNSTTVIADATGLAEVNHPGGACWDKTTPNMQPGDVVRIISASGIAEQTTVANVTAERPIVTALRAGGGGTVQIHGTAQDASGKPLPVEQVEHRLIANRDLFDLNGRRDLRAGAGLTGALAYDAPGSIRWTATYLFQTDDDLARAAGGTSTTGKSFVGAESRGIWLGRDPLALTESTIFENGPGVVGGPAGVTGCTNGAPDSGPLETPVPAATISAAPTFPDTALGGTSAPQAVTIRNSGGAPMVLDKVYLAGLNPGDFTLTGAPASRVTLNPGATLSVSVAFKPTAAGQRQANVSFSDDAANTTDQTVPLVAGNAAGGTPPPPPTTTVQVNTTMNFGTVAVNKTSRQTITVKNSGTQPLTFSSVGVDDNVDYTIDNTAGQTTCVAGGATSVPAGRTCNIVVVFTPKKTGSLPAKLTIVDNAQGGQQTVSITGAGK